MTLREEIIALSENQKMTDKEKFIYDIKKYADKMRPSDSFGAGQSYRQDFPYGKIRWTAGIDGFEFTYTTKSNDHTKFVFRGNTIKEVMGKIRKEITKHEFNISDDIYDKYHKE